MDSHTTHAHPTAINFHGKTIVITGAAGDIGLATAHYLGQLGARIGLLDLEPEKTQAAAATLTQQGITNAYFIADVTNPEQVKNAIDHFSHTLGPIHGLFNNAGYQGHFSPTHTYPLDDFNKVMHINVTGAFTVMSVIAQHMITHEGGAIVNTASMAAVGGPPNMIAYATSKAALIGMTQTASKDLAPYQIRVNAISPAYMGPGFMWTRQVELQAAAGSQYFDACPDKVAEQMIQSIPMRRYGHINEIVGAVAFLLSDTSSYITGVNLPISGGIL